MADECLVAITRELSVDLLFRGYYSGCFPWSGRPARWYSPDPRAIFEFDDIHFSRRLFRTIRTSRLEVTYDQAFRQVIECCADFHQSTWIDDEIVTKYVEFHQAGFAHSVEIWDANVLVGGAYGVQLRRMFAGESMFHHRRDTSKIAFYHLVEKLKSLGVTLFDAQVLNPHTQSLGATEIPRDRFLARLAESLGGDEPFGSVW